MIQDVFVEARVPELLMDALKKALVAQTMRSAQHFISAILPAGNFLEMEKLRRYEGKS